MPIPFQIPALHFDSDIAAATAGDLDWTCADPRLPDARADLPWGPGVYVWCARLTQAVLYIGKASGKGGLRSRVGSQELRWIRDGHAIVAAGADPEYLKDNWEAFSRVMVTHDAVVWWAPTESPAAARQWERNLLQRSIRETQAVPMVNGGAWWNRSVFWAEARAWAAAAAGRLAERRRAALDQAA